MLILGLIVCAAWAGFVGVPLWFALVGGTLLALFMLASAIIQLQVQHGFDTPYSAVRSDNTLYLLPAFAISLSLEWGTIFLVPLVLGRGMAWLLT